jgi:hypothetical protein
MAESFFTLPARHSDKAPRFDRREPSSLRTYTEDYEHLAGKARLNVEDKIKRFGMYMDPQDSDYIATLQEYSAANDWEAFIKAVFESYPGSKESDRYSIDDLYSLCNVQAVLRIVTRADFANFDRDFQRIAHALISQNIAGTSEIDRHYWAALDPAFRERLKTRLEVADPNHMSRVPWPREAVKKQAFKLLENAPGSLPDPNRISGPPPVSRVTPVPPLPSTQPILNDPVKAEYRDLEELFSKFAMTVSNSLENAAAKITNQMGVMDMVNRPRPQIGRLPPNYNPRPNNFAGPNNQVNSFQPRYDNRNRDGIVFGPAGSRPRSGCFMCHSADHFLSNCDVWRQYSQQGKCRRHVDGVVRMANGDMLPADPAGSPWVQRIDEFYRQNPQFLPARAQESSGNPGGNVQSNFVSVFAIPEVDTVEPAEKQAIFQLRGQINALIQEAVTVPEVERPAIETTINVLNARLQRKEEAIKARSKPKPTKPDPPSQENRVLRPTGAVPHVDIPAMPPKDKQPKPAPVLPLPAPIRNPGGPQYRYKAPVETEEAHKKVYEKILEQTVVLSVEECFATMPTVRKYFKDAVTGKRVPTEEEKAAGLVEVLEPASCSSFAVEIEPTVSFEAQHSLPLRCIELTLNDDVKADGILDCGCQVILMRKDIWSKLRVPMFSQKVMSMESANGTRNFTAGLVPRVKLTIGPVNVWCPVQVVENAPFEVLLGRPFMALCQAITRDFYNGNMEVTITDPETGDIVTISTYSRPDARPPSKESPESAQMQQQSGFY